MSKESNIMFDEMTFWIMQLEKIKSVAIETGSAEQTIGYLDDTIHDLIDTFQAEGEDDDDEWSTSYTIHFQDDREPRTLHIKLSGVITYDE